MRARFGWSLASRGRFAEAHEQFRLAAEQDPLSIVPPFDEFIAYYFERDLTGQQKSIQRLEQINPQFFGGPTWALVGAMARFDCATVVKNADSFVKTFPKLSLTHTIMAFDAVCRNDRPRALGQLKQMEAQHAPHYQLAIVYAILDDTENAIAELEKAADAHEGHVLYIKYEPFFDKIRNDPRYVALEKRVGLM